MTATAHISRTIRWLLPLLFLPSVLVAHAAGPQPAAPQIERKLQAHGVGHRIRIERVDGSEVDGVISLIDASSVQLRQGASALAVDVPFASIKAVHHGGIIRSDVFQTGPCVGPITATAVMPIRVVAALFRH